MSSKLRIEYNKNACIGNGSCAAIAPDHFELKGKKAKLLGSGINRGFYSKEVECSKTAAKGIIDAGIACPVNAIRVFDLDKNKDIVGFKAEDKGAKEIIASYDDRKDFVIDGKNYFLIRLDRENKNIEVGFCKEKNKVGNTIFKEKNKEELDEKLFRTYNMVMSGKEKLMKESGDRPLIIYGGANEVFESIAAKNFNVADSKRFNSEQLGLKPPAGD